MITHDVDEAILLADKIVLMTNGPEAKIAEIVANTLPRSRSHHTVHKEPHYYPIRNHLVDFLVSRSKQFAKPCRPATIRGTRRSSRRVLPRRSGAAAPPRPAEKAVVVSLRQHRTRPRAASRELRVRLTARSPEPVARSHLDQRRET